MSRLNYAHQILALIFKIVDEKVQLQSHPHHVQITMSPYNTPAYHSTSPTSHGLPSDEYNTDDMYEEWLRSRYDDRVYRRVSSRRDIDEYYNSDRARLNRGSGESIRMRYHNMNGYGSRASADDVGGPRLGSKFSFDSLDDA
ncbi:hypothetical protein GGP41_004646 [Bipolaris sorokiniana]|uniref:Uncharacterized protein n=1 Tax=Cochliobolus sativus TaxID=45130 RepID=A0A8H5ZEW9_COCSA|nr:hypothetical protein GGP41_004646 [Bipolaris sorokiniana]